MVFEQTTISAPNNGNKIKSSKIVSFNLNKLQPTIICKTPQSNNQQNMNTKKKQKKKLMLLIKFVEQYTAPE